MIEPVYQQNVNVKTSAINRIMKTLEYYSSDGTHTVFKNYAIDEAGVVTNISLGMIATRCESIDGYNRVNVSSKGKQHNILVGRAIASTFIGKPPTLHHTADHIDRVKHNDILTNIRWLCKKDQIRNRTVPTTYTSAFIIVKDGVEQTSKEWEDSLKHETNHLGRRYTMSTIKQYAQHQRHGFQYKVFHNLPREVWKPVEGSKNSHGGWYISSRSRMKYKTKYAENVLTADQLTKIGGYPVVKINGKMMKCHELSFLTFRPNEYAGRGCNDIILHKKDDRLDFGPFRLRLGSSSENRIDAHDNGKYRHTKTARKPVISYINDVIEKEHESVSAAVRYLKGNDHLKASTAAIGSALRKGSVSYGRTWKLVVD